MCVLYIESTSRMIEIAVQPRGARDCQVCRGCISVSLADDPEQTHPALEDATLPRRPRTEGRHQALCCSIPSVFELHDPVVALGHAALAPSIKLGPHRTRDRAEHVFAERDRRDAVN